MRDWIVTLLIGLASAGALLAFRRWRAVMPLGHAAADGGELVPQVGVASSAANDDGPMALASVTNTTIAQLPENRPIGVLEFEGPPGSVPVQPGEIVIGRHNDDDVRIPDVRVSRHHARLIARAGECEIHNLTLERPEPNPMLVNGERCEHARVADGDVVTLGGVSFKLRLKAG